VRRRLRRPPAHRLLLAFCVTLLLLLLVVQGLSTRTTEGSRTPATGTMRAAAVPGSLLTIEKRELVSRGKPPRRRIALSFDDGPDPRWTPRIAATLRRLRVPATFFVVGSQVVRHPEVVRDLHRQGFELGNHTFTHSDLSTQPGWLRALEVDLTESALAGAVGVRARLLRPPYSSLPGAVDVAEKRMFSELARQGHIIALADLDGHDWRRPGTALIVRGATPVRNRGGIVLLHDGGGDRSQTVAALERLVPRLKARGFRFVPVSELAQLPKDLAEVPAGRWERLRGRLLIATLAAARMVTQALALLLVLVGVLTLARALLLVVLARHHSRASQPRTPAPTFAKPVSVIVPAFNESVSIQRTVVALAASDYSEFEVIVVDDGSSDGTGNLVERLGLVNTRVLHQPNAGKAAALNRGIAAARHDVIVTVDADTVFEPETLHRLVQPFADPLVGAVSGNTKVGNRRRLLGRWQHIEYVMGFNLDRRLYDVLQCMPTVPGAVGAFRREALIDAGGMSAATLAEDTDATIAVGRAGWRVVYVDNARAWTEAPTSLTALWRQRYRWSYGTMQAVWKHKAAIWKRDEGKVGRRGIPYLVLFQITLPMLAPLVDLFALYGLLFLDPLDVLLYWGGFNALQFALALYAFRLDRESPRALWAMPLQQFVYRQLMYLVVIESVISALLGIRLRWHHSERSGEVVVAH
jgi:cellulose synthase/poly-beta-1,6-N-acetylglucosamine synthase-like glycosyltransferase/peptidoglycan/xylan/chitin deacetylase (PgdA/CDA1 family)